MYIYKQYQELSRLLFLWCLAQFEKRNIQKKTKQNLLRELFVRLPESNHIWQTAKTVLEIGVYIRYHVISNNSSSSDLSMNIPRDNHLWVPMTRDVGLQEEDMQLNKYVEPVWGDVLIKSNKLTKFNIKEGSSNPVINKLETFLDLFVAVLLMDHISLTFWNVHWPVYTGKEEDFPDS